MNTNAMTPLRRRYVLGVGAAKYQIAKLQDGKHLAWKTLSGLETLICVRCSWESAWAQIHDAAKLDVSRSQHYSA